MFGMKDYICGRGQIKLIIGQYDLKKKMLQMLSITQEIRGIPEPFSGYMGQSGNEENTLTIKLGISHQ